MAEITTPQGVLAILSRAGAAALAFLLCAYAHRVVADEGPGYELPELVVTASRIPVTYGQLTRTVRTITRAEIERSPAHSLQDLLRHVAGVDLRQRGPMGVQADVSVRGGTFEQTLVLVDGVKVSDPQTGHHNLNLPLTLYDVDRVEIVQGHGSQLYGPNAFGGIINFITRRDTGKSLSLGAFGGEYGLAGGELTLARSGRSLSQRLSLSGRRSAGHRQHTDFGIWTGFYTARLARNGSEASLTVGHTNRAFGADGYYSDRFLNEWEQTEATLVAAQAHHRHGRFEFSSGAHLRRHGDDFVLDRARPEWVRNRHTTHTRGLDFNVICSSGLGTTSVGGEIASDDIESSSLSDHAHLRGGVFLEHRVNTPDRLTLGLGASAYRHPGWGWVVLPGADIGYSLGRSIRAYGSAGSAFRAPTYTELYYDSPANRGNPDLQPEKARAYEAGLRYERAHLRAEVAVFRRKGRQLIDWVRSDSADPWQVRNAAKSAVSGIDVSFQLRSSEGRAHRGLPRLRIGYSYVDASRTSGAYESKYLGDHLRHKLSASAAGLAGRLGYTCLYSYRLRSGQHDHHLLDLRLSLDLGGPDLYLEATNVLDSRYSDLGSVRMPGRWVVLGLRYALGPGG